MRVLKYNKVIFTTFTFLAVVLTIIPISVSASSSCENNTVCIGNHQYEIVTTKTSKYFLSETINSGEGNCGNLTINDLNDRNITSSENGLLVVTKTIKRSLGKKETVKAYLKSTGIKCATTNFKQLTDQYGNAVSQYSFMTCPITEPNTIGKQADQWSYDKEITKEYDFSRNLWHIVVKQLRNVNVKLVNCITERGNKNCTFGKGELMNDGNTVTPQENGTRNFGQSISDVIYINPKYTSNSDGTSEVSFYLESGKAYYIEFDLATGDCGGVEVYHIQGATSTVTENTYRNGPICTDYKNYLGSNKYVTEKDALVPECSGQMTTLSVTSGFNTSKFEQDLRNKIEKAKQNLVSISQGSENQNLNLMCNFTDYNKDTLFSTKSGPFTKSFIRVLLDDSETEYWNAVCTEVVTISYDAPKVVQKIGTSFPYEVSIGITRTCEPVSVKVPTRDEKCTYSIECWGGPANHTGEAGAGPNNQFEQCISDCDDGKYTQSCINSCYKSVYGQEDLLKSSPSNLYDEYYAVKTSLEDNNLPAGGKYESNCTIGQRYMETRLPVSSCNVTHGNSDAGYKSNCTRVSCDSQHGITYTYLDGCNPKDGIGGTACYEVYTSSPSCIENYQGYLVQNGKIDYGTMVDDDYINKLYVEKINKSKAELDALTEKMKKFTNKYGTEEDEYKMTVINSYNGERTEYNKDQVQFKYSNGSNDEYFDLETYKSKYNGEDPSDGIITEIKNKETFDFPGTGLSYTSQTVSIRKNYSINLGESYVSNKNAGDVKYNLKTNTQKNGYTFGGNVYYTDISSSSINQLTRWPYFTTTNAIANTDPSIDKNILVDLKIGTWHEITHTQGVNSISCFYGLDKCTGYFKKEDCPCKENEICDPPDVEGLTYIFRTIDLGNMFPDREARWNWTSNSYDITDSDKNNGERYLFGNPDQLIEFIENKGQDIYEMSDNTIDTSGELDYQIKITPENIRNIRRYNTQQKNYNDFSSMHCTVNDKNMTVCKSDLLGEMEGRIENEYMTIEKRGMIGCNNEFANQCLEYYTVE